MSYIHRAPISQETKDRIYEYAERTQINENNELVSPNGTGQLITTDTRVDIGHKEGFENRYEVEFSSKAGLTQEQHNILFSNLGTFQLELHDENISHNFECKDKNEGMANVMLEAASTGRPIITTRIPGCQETFDEGVTGSTTNTSVEDNSDDDSDAAINDDSDDNTEFL